VRALADNQRRHLELANLLDGQIILAEVNAVGTGSHRDIGPVVDDAQDDPAFADVDKLNGKGEELVVLDVLCPQLDAIGAARYAAVS
jgi:hypothetical protein